MNHLTARLAAAAMLACAMPLAHADTPTYATLTLLTPPAGQSAVWANALNDQGLIAGRIMTTETAQPAGLWSSGTWTALGSANGFYGDAVALNNAGTAVGMISESGLVKAVVWEAGSSTPTVLPGLMNNRNESTDINATGQIVGTSGNRAVLWNQGQVTDLGTISQSAGSSSFATGINSSWTVIGGSSDGSAGWQAAIWREGVATRLRPVTGDLDSYAYDINDSGQVVGMSADADGIYQAVIWNDADADAVRLALPSGTLGSAASKINEHGVVAGSYAVAPDVWHGALWIGDRLVDLNDHLDPTLAAQGWTITAAADINNQGHVLARLRDSGGEYHAALITAIPEPGTWMLMALGLVGLTIARRRHT